MSKKIIQNIGNNKQRTYKNMVPASANKKNYVFDKEMNEIYTTLN